ncbi:MAG TPA: ChbG/HpnK family deacetylase [Candidatus Acidoferrales bacterium]|nr:ChbG/HpnK family deacetylase [Candidatus Acidoferrales bacterium]
MKLLLVNADDFGLTEGVNRAIAECHTRGMVTSTTLMATGAAFECAVELSRSLPNLSVGCHMVLVDGEPLLPPDAVRSLLAPGTNRFYHSIGEFARAALLGKFRPDEIEAEASAQFDRLHQAGVRISHFDSHKHTHLFPAVLGPVLRAAKRAGINAVRNPFEPSSTLSMGTVLRDRKLAVRTAEVLVLRSYRQYFMKQIRAYGMWTPDGSIGVAATGSLTQEILCELIERMPEGTWELCCHPGYNDSALDSIRTKLRQSRMVELEALTSRGVRDLLAREGVVLQSFRQQESNNLSPLP